MKFLAVARKIEHFGFLAPRYFNCLAETRLQAPRPFIV
jgi:hypothetical protein